MKFKTTLNHPLTLNRFYNFTTLTALCCNQRNRCTHCIWQLYVIMTLFWHPTKVRRRPNAGSVNQLWPSLSLCVGTCVHLAAVAVIYEPPSLPHHSIIWLRSGSSGPFDRSQADWIWGIKCERWLYDGLSFSRWIDVFGHVSTGGFGCFQPKDAAAADTDWYKRQSADLPASEDWGNHVRVWFWSSFSRLRFGFSGPESCCCVWRLMTTTAWTKHSGVKCFWLNLRIW